MGEKYLGLNYRTIRFDVNQTGNFTGVVSSSGLKKKDHHIAAASTEVPTWLLGRGGRCDLLLASAGGPAVAAPAPAAAARGLPDPVHGGGGGGRRRLSAAQ